MTNVLVEGGGRLLGSLFDARAIDEVHVFLGSKLVGGADAPSPLAGTGVERLTEALPLIDPQFERLGDDFYLYGRLGR
jgi:diaminohydroxyphosphoribosylaminopyrimidine deaminase/5-amino-6-(5-phosphoribosylamino)uracil reductase